MTGEQKIILLLTFVTGAFAGMFFYVTSFAPQYASDDVPEKSEMTITGDMYGGCVRGGGCASFHLSENREYQYIVGEKKESGRLPVDILKEITSLLSDYRLASYSGPTAVRDCVSYVDGIDYAYKINYEGKSYVLDTCKTTFPQNSELQQAFSKAFIYMANPTTTYPAIIEKGIGKFFIDRFQNGG